jgi:hypothetical protein
VTADPHSPLTPLPAPLQAEPHDGSGNSASGLKTEEQSTAPPAQPRLPVLPRDIWLHRISSLLFVIVCATFGVLLVIMPWSLQWTDNRLLWGHPDAKAFLAHPFVRGVCSGLGILDLWIGFREAVHYHEDQPQ